MRIRNHILYILTFAFWLSFIVSCREDFTLIQGQENASENELSLEFDLFWPDQDETRAIIDGLGNERFSENDMIHILGTFNTKSNKEDGTGVEKTIIRYGALRYNGRLWEKVDGSMLTWPSTAVSGSFVAYFISESNGILTEEAPSKTYSLSNLSVTTDPLMATAKNIKYGNAIPMTFNHICSYLTLLDLEPMVANQYWFMSDGVKTKENGESKVFNNAFRISLGNDGTFPTLNFEFCREPDTDYKDIIYISGNTEEYTESDINGGIRVLTKAFYFLEPGYYESFSLAYPSIKPDIYPYLQYDYTNIPENVGAAPNNKPNLEGNKSYTLDITKSPGITIHTPTTPGGCDENDDSYVNVDVEAFLTAITKGEAYSENGKEILKAVPGGTELIRNVDFQNFDYSKFNNKEFIPDIDEKLFFDGGLHYIRNLHDPLFHFNRGTIKNIGIKQFNGTNIVSIENKDQNLDNSSNGVLCHWNRGQAVISNVRLIDVEMNVFVQCDDSSDTDPDSSEVHNIGGVAGSNTGLISEVAFGGTINITVAGDTQSEYVDNVNASVLIGGVAGQLFATGTIYDVSRLDNNSRINITNTCHGVIGSYAVGGIVGQSSGFITGVILGNLSIDSSQSVGQTSYIGGMVGNLSVNESNSGALDSCIAGGSVKAGTSIKYKDLNSGSYIGGIAGVVLNLPVSDCRSSVSVYGPTEHMVKDNVVYATGGAFGRIRKGNYSFEDIIAYGTNLEGPNKDKGNFVGIAPAGEDWDVWYKQNFDTFITVKQFTGLDNVGGNID